MKKKALFIFPTDRMGGAERITYMAARQAVQMEIFDQLEILVLSRRIRNSFDAFAQKKNIKVTYIASKKQSYGLVKMGLHIGAQRYELVFSSATHINAVLSLLRGLRILKTTLLITRESTTIFERNFGWKNWPIRKLYKLYGKQDAIICQTEHMLKSLNRNTGGRLSELLICAPNPVDFTRITEEKEKPLSDEILAIEKDRIKIVWCGRISAEKSPQIAIETLKNLLEAGQRKMHLIVIGDGPLRQEIEQQTEQHDLKGNVTFTGHQDNPYNIMAHCQLGLITSEKEGFPNVILEMLASGVKHVITTDCAGDLTTIPGVCVVPFNESTSKNLAHCLAVHQHSPPNPKTAQYIKGRTTQNFIEKILKFSESNSSSL